MEVDAEPETKEADDGSVDEGNASNASEETKSVALDAESVRSGTGAEGENGEIQPVEEVKLKKIIKKKVPQIVETCQMFMGLDKISSEMNELTTVFFIRSSDGIVPSAGDLESLGGLNNHFEFSIFTGDVLYGIANLLHQVYYPVIERGIIEVSKPEIQVDESLKHELGTNMKKFEQQIRHVVQQSQGDARLFIPPLVILNIETAADDLDIVGEIEAALEDWTSVVSAAVEAELHKVTKRIKTPLGEIEFWRERNASLSALYEQINLLKVQQMLQVMKLIENPQLSSFNYHFGELSKLYLEAKDNVKFLTTLERHFKHLHNGSFQTISESMQSMVNGLRMVWVISRHYNTDERMAPLMETVAEMLAKRVKEEVRLFSIFCLSFLFAFIFCQKLGCLLFS